MTEDELFHELYPLHPDERLHASVEDYDPAQLAAMDIDAQAVLARYPAKRSGMLPLLHLVQSVDGYVSGRGVNWVARTIGVTTAEVSAVATFYSQYKRRPNGQYTIGVCTNTLCAVMGGDMIFDRLKSALGIGHNETTEDGMVTLERIECNAGCDYAPVVMVNWEFFDNQTPDSAERLAADLRAGKDVAPTRGAGKVVTFKEMERVLAGFLDGRADEGVGAGPASLRGLRIAHGSPEAEPRVATDNVDGQGTPAQVPAQARQGEGGDTLLDPALAKDAAKGAAQVHDVPTVAQPGGYAPGNATRNATTAAAAERAEQAAHAVRPDAGEHGVGGPGSGAEATATDGRTGTDRPGTEGKDKA